MRTASDQAPAAQVTLEHGADEIINLATASERTGISVSTLQRRVKSGWLRPRRQIRTGKRTETFVTVRDVIERGSPGHVQGSVRHERYKRAGGLSSNELAHAVGCSQATVSRYAKQLPGQKLGAKEDGRQPWLFAPEAVEVLRRLKDEAWEQRSEKIGQHVREAWRSGRIKGRPRRLGVEKPCACGCGRLVYRAPCLQYESGHFFYDSTCYGHWRRANHVIPWEFDPPWIRWRLF